MKKIFVSLMLTALVATTACAQNAPLIEVSYGENLLLPAVETCTNSAARTTKLNAVSGEKGYWTERDYTTQNGTKIHAVWIDGAAPVGWKAKKNEGTQTDGVWGSGATFKSVTLSGYNAEFENHPQLGTSLTICLPKAVLTLESKKATEEELIAFSEKLLQITQTGH